MPDAWAHLICSQLAAQHIRDVDRRSLLLSQTAALNLGCQAPDFFYYHNFRPWQTGRTLNMVSAAIHAERCGDFAMELVRRSCLLHEERESALAFACGFICHWVLDRVTHPFVHYRAGVPRKPQGVSLRSINRHKHLELTIDVLMAKRHLSLDPRTTDFRAHTRLPKVLPQRFAALMEETVRHIYPTIGSVQVSGFAGLAYQDMLSSHNWSFDPEQRKQKYFWRWLDRVFALQSWGVFYPGRLDVDVDYLNEARSAWCHPANAAESYTDSFQDLFDLAVEESRGLIEAVLAFSEGTIADSELRELLGDASYSTGKNWRLGLSILLYDAPLPLNRPY